MKGEAGAREELARCAGELLKHGEEVAQLVHFALKQTEKRSPRPTGT